MEDPNEFLSVSQFHAIGDRCDKAFKECVVTVTKFKGMLRRIMYEMINFP